MDFFWRYLEIKVYIRKPMSVEYFKATEQECAYLRTKRLLKFVNQQLNVTSNALTSKVIILNICSRRKLYILLFIQIFSVYK